MGRWSVCVLAISATCCAIGFGQPAEASAGSLSFDPNLSLVGNCSISEVDPVADPGCPGGSHPPAGPFNFPRSAIADDYGDVYIASFGNELAGGAEGRIDIFDAEGKFLAEIKDAAGPQAQAIDSKGNLYVFQFATGEVVLYRPSVYHPEAKEVAYENPPVLVVETPYIFCGLAVNPQNDHLFVQEGEQVQEFSAAEEGNEPLATIGAREIHSIPTAIGLAVDAAHDRLYAGGRRSTPAQEPTIYVFSLSSHTLLGEIDGGATPGGKFAFEPSIAVDESDGTVYVYPEGKAVYVYALDGSYLGALEHSFKYPYGAEIGVDNGEFSPHPGYLFVPSHPTGVGHVFAFGPSNECAASIESASADNITETEVDLLGTIQPCGLKTSYVFELTTQGAFEEHGFQGATVVSEGELSGSASPISVSASIDNLLAGTAYRFRLRASNELGPAEQEGGFATYPSSSVVSGCPNEAVRIGPARFLPDCRAFELVTPPATNARSPRGVGVLGPFFGTRESSPAGNRLSFITEGGTLPGSEGTGSLGGDPYLATRDSSGWTTVAAGPSGAESVALLPGSTSPDQGYEFWNTGGEEGSAAVDGDSSYVRYPDGHSSLVGRGSLGVEPHALGKLITENGQHIIFMTTADHNIPAQLEPGAPPTGTQAVYDRTADEVTHVISLLPGNVPLAAGEDAEYVGASLDGRGVAFTVDGTLYLRYDNAETFEIGVGAAFAGIAEGGSRIFYLKEGKLLRFDANNGKTTAFNGAGTVIPVNVSADGSAGYFVSTAVLTKEANPNGAKAKAGQQNLYLSEEGAISFVGTVTEADVNGVGGVGLGLWAPHVVSYGEAAEDPSRTTPDGSVLLFESRANLTGYDSGGHNQVYRFDSVHGELDCLSCVPTGAPASGTGTLQSVAFGIGDPQPLSLFGYVANLRADGRRAFFQSTEPLVTTDTDSLQDVYEWEAQGVGSCTRPNGCVYLISSGQSQRVDYLYAVSDSGDDVFFRSSDLLLSVDLEETPSIYDARVEGGFPEEAIGACEGEGCRSQMAPSPSLLDPESSVHASKKKPKKRCPRGKRKLRRHGQVRCVKKKARHRHHPPHHDAGSNRKGVNK
jgi:hypothetical protein